MTTPAGIKHDTGKPRLGLISTVFMWGLGHVLTFGARKYAAHNWRKGFVYSRLYDALQRHLTAWNDGEDIDAESGMNHLDHAACELMFLREMVERHPELDDRYKPEPEANVVAVKYEGAIGGLHGPVPVNMEVKRTEPSPTETEDNSRRRNDWLAP